MNQILDTQNETIVINYLIEGIYPSILVISKNGKRIFLDPRDPFITVHYLQSQSWEPQLTEIFEKIFTNFNSHKLSANDGAVFIDCGANIGLHSMKAAQIGYEVFAFEPDPITYKFLELNGRINGLQIKSKKLAVSDVDGFLDFTIDSQSTGMSGLSKNESGVGRFTGLGDPHQRFTHISVESVTLSKHFADLMNDTHRGLLCLKIDTEGAEGEVLEGSRELIQRFESYVIICELHLDNFKLIEQFKHLIEAEILANKFIKMQFLRFMQEPITVNHLESNSWHKHGNGDLALFVSSRNIL